MVKFERPNFATERARRMRRESTDAEKKLWRLLRDRRLAGAKFRRQVPIGPYIVDFICHRHKVIVEADGGQHADSARDRIREQRLTNEGFTVIRYNNYDILKNPEGVLLDLYAKLPHGSE